ncbi:histidine kinase [Phytohabitans sp. LJ34]|uniref:sensor histidine kinase n=1 Tax=Phytohabitans sp. LJ34 TaxID=3452217 RepID=UPI003F8907A8
MAARVWWPPAALAVAQLAWWPVVPALLDEPVRPAAVVLALLGTTVACGALAWRHTAPGPALAATLAAAVPLGAGLGWSAPFGFVAAGVALFTLAAVRTAGIAAAGAAATLLALTATVALRDTSVRVVIGYGLIVLAALTVIWVAGRSRRRRHAGRAAVAVFEAESAGMARHAAAAERRRLAAELHDVAAHRLTAIVVSTAAAARLDDPALAAEATRHAVDAGRQALTELDRLADISTDGIDPAAAEGQIEEEGAARDKRRPGAAPGAADRTTADAGAGLEGIAGAGLEGIAGAGGLEGIERLVAERPEVTYTRPDRPVPPEAAAVAYRVVREALTNTARYAAGAPVTVALEAAAGELVVSVVDGGGTATAPDLGSGSGLAGLRTLVEAAGGTLWAGPDDTPSLTKPAAGTQSAGPDGAPPLTESAAGTRSGGTLSAGPLSGGPLSGGPVSGGPLSGGPVSGGPLSGGPLSAGPDGARGWRVRAVLPIGAPPGGRRPEWRGPAALDWALTVLAVALPVGAGFLPGNQPDPLGRATPGTALLLLFLVLFAAPLRWRRVAPMRAVLANLAALLAWLGAERAGWTPTEGTDLLGYTLWAQFVLAYSVGAYRQPAGRGRAQRPDRARRKAARGARRIDRARREAAPAAGRGRGWPAPLAIAAVDAFVMVSGLTGDVVAGWAIFTVLLAGPVTLAWAAGVWTRARRRRRGRRREAVEGDAAAAARAERSRIAAGLRATARRHTAATVVAAEAGHLPEVLAEARAGLAAMRDLLTDLHADGDGGDEPPPTLAGAAVLAARRRAMVRYTGTRRALPAEIEVAGYRLADALVRAEGTLAVTYLPDGVRLAATWPIQADPIPPSRADGLPETTRGLAAEDEPVDERRVRDLADAAGGAVTGATPGAATVWLPG